MPDKSSLLPRVLVIEDQADTRFFLEKSLSMNFRVESVENAIIGLDKARNSPPDLILLDVMLPVLSGWDACKLLREDPRTQGVPVLFLTAKGSPKDIENGLTLGAEDYIKKPFDIPELIARVQARIDRSKKEGEVLREVSIKGLRLFPSQQEVMVGEKKIELTSIEFQLLYFLCRNTGTVMGREKIWRGVWKHPSENKLKDSDLRTIDVHVRALRKKIPVLEKYLKAIYGKGYVFES